MPANNAGSDKDRNGKFRLEIPLDASKIQDVGTDRGVKVAVFNPQGQVQEQVVRFDKGGAARVAFNFAERPASLRVVVGPETASADQLKGLQTLMADVPSRQWSDKGQLVLNPIVISNYYWLWWLRWCRRYKITGRVVCPNGGVVAGAQVCAYDVDWWWWWWSKDLVGCATTDVNGAFEIDFTRCCGWWPWWWWEQRVWQLNPGLVDRILPVLRQDPRLTKIPVPSPQPDPQIFQSLISAPGGMPNRQGQRRQLATPGSRSLSGSNFDPGVLDSLRTNLLKALPPAPELERLRLWPWWPWSPWWDCDADIVFTVTQNCHGNQVIVDENIWDAHNDIPADFNVTLTASENACCTAPPCGDDCPSGDCMLPTDICSDNIGSIGGNEGAAASPVGLFNPGQGLSLSYGADRPYSGSVPIYGQWGDLANVDYYELLVYYAGDGTPGFPDPVVPPLPLPSPPFPSADYSPMSTPAFGGFERQHLVYTPLPNWPYVPFLVQPISDGTVNHNVIETIAHYEADNGPQLWDSATLYLLAVMNTVNNLPNGTYYLQLRGWQRPGGTGNLTNPQILPICGTQDSSNPVPNYFVVTIDNQSVTSGPTDINGLPCGLGTVHVCTGQPESAILGAQILHQDGTVTPIGACGNVCIVSTDQLLLDIAAYDPDAYLAYYTLQVVYGASLVVDLLAIATKLEASPAPAPWAPATSLVGPDYGSALAQGASAPWWTGGSIRVTVPAAQAFPETCAYDVQLYVHKRTIGGGGASGCDGGFWNQYNLSELSFTIVNPCPGSAVG
jgi:hypothetical protein